jgi:putative transposase
MKLPDGSIRKLRRTFNDIGHAHELTFSCYRRYPLLSKDRSRDWFIKALDHARQKWEFDLWAYVIMPEHVHVLLYPRRSDYDIANIRKTIKQIVSRLAIRFLKQNASIWLTKLQVHEAGRTFHRFWQPGGGYDRNIRTAKVAWSAVHYIHNNPVRRELAASPADWVYSSARWYEGLDGVILPMDDRPPDP